MEQYIPKSALVAEFNRLIAELVEEGEGTMFEQGRISAFEDAKLFLNTLEVKEVDLNKEIELVKGDYEQVDVAWNNDFDYIAKHFFELGIEKFVDESIIRKIVDLNNEAAKHYDAIMKKERNENGFSQLAIDLLDHNVDANELRIQYIIENLKAQKGE